MVVEMQKGPVGAVQVSGCSRNCGACPMARFCRPQTGEIKRISGLEEVSPKSKGFYVFNPSIQRDSELPTPINKFVSSEMKTDEKKCTICGESAFTCGHSKSKTDAQAAA